MVTLSNMTKSCNGFIKRLYRNHTGIHTFSTMTSTNIPKSIVIDENFLHFQLFEVLNIDQTLFQKYSRYQHLSPDIIKESLLNSKNISEKYFVNHVRKNDLNEPTVDSIDGSIQIIPEVTTALEKFKESGYYRLV